jgi:hypothetical protein
VGKRAAIAFVTRVGLWSQKARNWSVFVVWKALRKCRMLTILVSYVPIKRRKHTKPFRDFADLYFALGLITLRSSCRAVLSAVTTPSCILALRANARLGRVFQRKLRLLMGWAVDGGLAGLVSCTMRYASLQQWISSRCGIGTHSRGATSAPAHKVPAAAG